MIMLEDIRIYSEIDLNIILYGNTVFSLDQNKDIFMRLKSF